MTDCPYVSVYCVYNNAMFRVNMIMNTLQNDLFCELRSCFTCFVVIFVLVYKLCISVIQCCGLLFSNIISQRQYSHDTSKSGFCSVFKCRWQVNDRRNCMGVMGIVLSASAAEVVAAARICCVGSVVYLAYIAWKLADAASRLLSACWSCYACGRSSVAVTVPSQHRFFFSLRCLCRIPLLLDVS